jgi:hypothetical protein
MQSEGSNSMKKRSIFLGSFIAVLALALTGCPERRRISDISADPGRYMDKEVTVIGRVTRSYGAGPVGIYEVDDGTGRIWIATERYGVPSKDTYVGVTGRITPTVTWGGHTYGTGMRETKRRTREKR